ncbi:MAG TPA: DUF4124 domain-containing protein [Nitrosomonas sp.]|uniref:DUF4124 domain-containing protein n=1 Tax=Nitrosomonas sp. TaxID=42353 RepID=UPI000E8C2A8D|nr:DUF4124 domain-containing protein [Nitrosomonas sp.]GJL76166.1 MAG: hypothetical protein NMNS02_22720 [Nitrosomonas sp.]HBV21359.1 DUF4124 domain-containing protein [Nitrosomonas sp.]HNP25815.1 DUF4124 domain-containing protein [Nitrosomonas sp.]
MGTPSIFIILILLSFNFTSASHAGSTIYKHVDKDGNITFTNRPITGGQKFQSALQSHRPQISSPKTLNHFPKESVNTQNKRDINRRTILEHELATEMKLFSDTQKNLVTLHNDEENSRQKENVRQLQSKLQRHQNNITALKMELTKL